MAPFKIIMLIVIGWGILGVVKNSLAADHYIRNGAQGASNGNNWTDAWSSLPAVLTRGDTYYIADGDYGRYVFDDAIDGEKYIYIKKAIVSNHGTETGWDNSYGDGQAVFSWISGSEVGSVLAIKTSFYEIDGQRGGFPNWQSGHGFKFTTDNPKAVLANITHNGTGTAVAGNIHIYKAEFAHTGRETNPDAAGSYGPLAIQTAPTGGLYSSGNHIFSHNYFHDSPVMLGWGYMPGSILWEYNYFDTSAALESGSTVQGSGITIYGASNIIYRYNIFKDIKGSCGLCLYTWHGDLAVDNVKIYGNIFYYSPEFKASSENRVQNGWIATDGGTTKAENIKIYNNTFINLSGSRMFWIGYAGALGNEFKNNIIYQCQGVKISDGEFQGFTHSHNWYYGNVDYRNNNSLDLNWSGENNPQIGIGSPFVDLLNDNFRLSAATDSGDTSIGIEYSKDFDGIARGNDDIWDRGAHEYPGSSDITSPAAPIGLSVR